MLLHYRTQPRVPYVGCRHVSPTKTPVAVPTGHYIQGTVAISILPAMLRQPLLQLIPSQNAQEACSIASLIVRYLSGHPAVPAAMTVPQPTRPTREVAPRVRPLEGQDLPTLLPHPTTEHITLNPRDTPSLWVACIERHFNRWVWDYKSVAKLLLKK